MDKKNQHILAINHILAEFDIETQVKKITLETLDAYMRGYIPHYLAINKHFNSSKNQKINSLISKPGSVRHKPTTKISKSTSIPK